MKRINWPVSLRMRQLHVNQFHVERSADVILLVDTFVNIGQRPHSTLDFTLRAAAGLAQAYLRQTDRVGLIEVGGWLRWTKPASGPRQYETILRSLTRATVTATDLRRNAPDLPEAMLPRHALIIALTPLADERFVHVVTGLADQGRDVVLLAIGGDEVSLPYLTRRAGHPVVRRVWRLLREDRLRELRSHGMRAALWSPRAADRGGAGIGGAPRHARGRMVWLSGIAAVLLIAGVPCLVLPERHVLGAGVVAAAICAGGLLLPSLGLATAGAVLAVLVFSVALLVASAANAVMAAMLMGIAVLVLLDATHFHQRFNRSAITPGVVRAHLGQLGATILVSVLAVGVLAVVSDAFWLGLDAALRPAVAAAGGILVVLAILRATTR